MQVADVFHALGDPIRLEMVQRLARSGPHTISSVSSKLHITRQGARKHLQVLADAHMISLKTTGRETEVRLLRDTLDQGKSFLTRLELQWDKRLEALKTYVESASSS